MEREILQFPIVPVVERTIVTETSQSKITYSPNPSAVETPVGTFENCIYQKELIMSEKGNWVIYSIFAPNVGLVKQYQENPKGEISYLLELVKYKTYD